MFQGKFWPDYQYKIIQSLAENPNLSPQLVESILDSIDHLKLDLDLWIEKSMSFPQTFILDVDKIVHPAHHSRTMEDYELGTILLVASNSDLHLSSAKKIINKARVLRSWDRVNVLRKLVPNPSLGKRLSQQLTHELNDLNIDDRLYLLPWIELYTLR